MLCVRPKAERSIISILVYQFKFGNGRFAVFCRFFLYTIHKSDKDPEINPPDKKNGPWCLYTKGPFARADHCGCADRGDTLIRSAVDKIVRMDALGFRHRLFVAAEMLAEGIAELGRSAMQHSLQDTGVGAADRFVFIRMETEDA